MKKAYIIKTDLKEKKKKRINNHATKINLEQLICGGRKGKAIISTKAGN